MFKLELKSVVAGFLIGLGVIINTLTTIPLVGPALFSFGLLTIITLQLPLYTGKIGFLNKKSHIILLYNLAGIILCILFYGFANPDFILLLQQNAEIKFSKSILQMLIYGIYCGTLIHFAVKTKHTIITIMAIMIFILIGGEHCIADYPYLCLI